ncbi:hypothetical protein ACFFHF_09930 [Robertmurraya beringensis]|uniref:Uncharacterized protein n=1 Tax=Robertmurraya beringensis TaxID=641660 RepID=A0ABV6KQF4_9BACI
MKKVISIIVILLVATGIYSPPTKAAEYDSTFCKQYEGVKKIWWDGMELKPGQIGRLNVEKDTPLFKLDGEKKVFSRTLKAGEFYRIYAFKPGMLSVGGGYYVDRDSKVTYQTPSKAKLQAVQCISNPYGSKTNPTKIGDTWRVKFTDPLYGYMDFYITLTEAITDKNKTAEMIRNANIFNGEAPAGKKFILAKFKFKLNKFEGKISKAWSPNQAYLEAVSKKGVVYDQYIGVVPPEPNLQDIYEGGTTEGWTYFIVDENDEPTLIWDRDFEDELWFKLK